MVLATAAVVLIPVLFSALLYVHAAAASQQPSRDVGVLPPPPAEPYLLTDAIVRRLRAAINNSPRPSSCPV